MTTASSVSVASPYIRFEGRSWKSLADMPEDVWERYYAREMTQKNRINLLSGSGSGSRSSQSTLYKGAGGSSNNILSGGLFGDNFGLGGAGSSLGIKGSYLDTAKDLARFRLGLDKDQAQFSRGLREDEAQADFGRAFKLQDQSIGGQKLLEDTRQTATTDRLEKELANRMNMQREGFDFTLLKQGKERAAALRGLR